MKIGISQLMQYPELNMPTGPDPGKQELFDLYMKQVGDLAGMSKGNSSEDIRVGRVKTLIPVGSINKKTPTVSELLHNHPDYRNQCWKIIFSDINKSKGYRSIQDNTEIYIDPESNELHWGKDLASDKVRIASPTQTGKPEIEHMKRTVSGDLENAVESCIGKTYSEMNCYELVVEGLEKMGVNYRGKGGMSEYLISLARERGLPYNTYLTGEGIVGVSGSILYTKTIDTVTRPDREAGDMVKELESVLEKGTVLSFSTRSSGHTGVVSKEGGLWTYINSGFQNNTVGGGTRRKEVGEETLANEIRNWFRNAKKRNESLTITLGRFDERKLSMFSKDGVSVKV